MLARLVALVMCSLPASVQTPGSTLVCFSPGFSQIKSAACNGWSHKSIATRPSSRESSSDLRMDAVYRQLHTIAVGNEFVRKYIYVVISDLIRLLGN